MYSPPMYSLRSMKQSSQGKKVLCKEECEAVWPRHLKNPWFDPDSDVEHFHNLIDCSSYHVRHILKFHQPLMHFSVMYLTHIPPPPYTHKKIRKNSGCSWWWLIETLFPLSFWTYSENPIINNWYIFSNAADKKRQSLLKKLQWKHYHLHWWWE